MMTPATRSQSTFRSVCFSTGSATRNCLFSSWRLLCNHSSTIRVICSCSNTFPSAKRFASPVMSGGCNLADRTNVTGPSAPLRRVTSFWASLSNYRYRWRSVLYCSSGIVTCNSLLIASTTVARKSTVILCPRLHSLLRYSWSIVFAN
jgi:hypothetical protein